jgi:hypothetical protein
MLPTEQELAETPLLRLFYTAYQGNGTIFRVPAMYLKSESVKEAVKEVSRYQMRQMLGDEWNALEKLGIAVLQALLEYGGVTHENMREVGDWLNSLSNQGNSEQEE